jgi:hypothetical protein
MTSTVKQTCPLCGRQDRRACGLLAYTGKCGLPDPRLRAPVAGPDAEAEHKPMNERSTMAAARRGLALLAPCGAHARTTGQPCKRPPCRGSTRCNLHGGRSTGPRPTSGKRTLRQQRTEHYVSLLLAALEHQHGHEKPEPTPVALGDDGEWRRTVQDENGEWQFADID